MLLEYRGIKGEPRVIGSLVMYSYFSGLHDTFDLFRRFLHSTLIPGVVPIVGINWLIMTIALKNTEEKWLLDLYGNEYEEYKKRVNRCIPWFPKR